MSEQLEITFPLPEKSWDEGMELPTKSGGKLRRWGSIREMSRILFDLDREACYLLIESEEVEGFKLGKARNSHYRVNLLSAWEYRQANYGR